MPYAISFAEVGWKPRLFLSRNESGLLDTLQTLDAYRNRTGSDAALSNAILIAHLLPPLGIPLSSGLRATARKRPYIEVDGPRDFAEDAEDPPMEEPGAPQPDETDVVAEMVELEEEVDLGHPPSMAHDETPISLPFARRDIERLGLLAAVGSKLHRTDLPKATERNLSRKPYFEEALLLAEIHCLDADVVGHWRGVASVGDEGQGEDSGENLHHPERPRPLGETSERRPRRRGRRRPGRPRGPAA